MSTKEELIEFINGGEEYSHYLVVEITAMPEHLGFASIALASTVEEDELGFMKRAAAYANWTLNEAGVDNENTTTGH